MIWSFMKMMRSKKLKSRMVKTSGMPRPMQHWISKFKKSDIEGKIWHYLVHIPDHTNLSILSNTTCKPFSHMLELPIPLPDRGREYLSVQYMSLSNQSIKCRSVRPFGTQSTETSLMRSFMSRHQWWISSKVSRTVGSQRASIWQDTTIFRSLKWCVTCSTGNVESMRKTNPIEGNT